MNDTSAQRQVKALADRILDADAPESTAWQADVDELATLALSEHPETTATASRALFRDVVETLADRFEPALCDRYIRFFGRVIEVARREPALGKVDRLLRSFGLGDEAQVLDRASRVRRPVALPLAGREGVRKVLVPSRVTLGADIAVTSVVLDKMKDVCAQAEIVLLGGAKAGAFFAGDSRVRLREVAYARGGLLRDRLAAWPLLVDLIGQEIAGLKPEEYLVVDPDSRLTQLGLLPLVPDESRYVFFESRSFAGTLSASLGDLTAQWLDQILGTGSQPSLPYVSLSEEDRRRGAMLRESSGGRRIASVNLGVGGNQAKRVAGPFEGDLLSLLHSRGYAIVLDQGAGDEELSRTSDLIRQLQELGVTVSQLGDAPTSIVDVNVWQGSLSGFAGFIASSDLYVGYDSAGGHLAAALGVRGIDIFAGAVSPRMIERWTPWGSAPGTVVAVEPGQASEDVLDAVRERLP